jgi:hypothetical protein
MGTGVPDHGAGSCGAGLAIISTKPAEHFSRSAGGYFAGMVRKAERGEFRLERSLGALREARTARPIGGTPIEGLRLGARRPPNGTVNSGRPPIVSARPSSCCDRMRGAHLRLNALAVGRYAQIFVGNKSAPS